MNATETIYARRAIRDYTSQKVDEATVRALLQAAVQAPSAMNRQPWLFAVVQDVAQLKRYSDRAKSILVAQMTGDPKAARYAGMLSEPNFNIFYNASTLVVIGVGERGTYTDADCWLAAQNLMLEACELGLGTCPIGFAFPLLNTPDVKTELGLPPDASAIVAIVVGHPAAAAEPVPRAEPRVVAWIRHAGSTPTKAA